MNTRILFTIVITIGMILLSVFPASAYSHDLNENTDTTENIDPNMDNSVPKDSYWYYKPSGYAELVSWYQNLEANYSDYIEVFKANELYNTSQATGGYDLYYVRITNESTGFHKPEVLFLGGPHGDETVGTIGMYWFLDWFCRKAFTDEPCTEYSKDWLHWLVDNREIYFEISHNPYGFDHGPQRYDGNSWDLNREADYDGPGSPTGGIWASENGQTLVKFINNHTIRVGCDIHGGTRSLLYPWAGTHNSVYGTSPISGETYSAAPPDFYFYDAVGLRLGAFMGETGGDGPLDESNVGTIDELIWYSVYGGLGPWAYGADVITNPNEDPYVEDETFGNYPGSGILWYSPEMSYTKNPSEYSFGNDTTPGWGWEMRRYILHQTDIVQPYLRWQPGTVENHMMVDPGDPISLNWQVNGSMVVDHTYIQYGTDPDPIINYDQTTTDNDQNQGNYVGGTGWENADDGSTDGMVYNENIIITNPGDYYFVATAQVDQVYKNVLDPSEYGNEPYLRMIKERTNASYYESLNGTDGLEEIIGQDWWHSPIIHVTVGGNNVLVSNASVGWNFVSVPFNTSVNKINLNVEENDIEYSWTEAVSQGLVSDYLFGWNDMSQSYQFSDMLHPGKGYWMYCSADCSIRAENVSTGSDDYITSLSEDWNVVGCPQNNEVSKSMIEVTQDGSVYSWQDAVNAGILNEYVFGWNSLSQSYTFSDVFTPGSAYWMYTFLPCKLRTNSS